MAWAIRLALGVITGEVGAGKTVALRAALAELDASRHTVIYLPNPAVGARGIYAARAENAVRRIERRPKPLALAHARIDEILSADDLGHCHSHVLLPTASPPAQ